MQSFAARVFSIVLLFSPFVCAAQSQNLATRNSVFVDPSSEVASVHELQIPDKARAACNKGTKFLRANDPARSIPEFRKAIQGFPDYFEAYAKLGAAHVELQQWDDAAAAFRKSIELSGGQYAPAEFGLGLIEATVTLQFDDAERAIRAELQDDPGDVSGKFLLGWVFYSTNRLQAAEETARAVISSQPMFGAARLLLAQIHIKEDNLAAVVSDLDEYTSLGITGPDDDKVRKVRAAAFRELHPDDTGSQVASTNER
jgi:tetratricopeptide (TPR) repeat protein